jgi:hypothetical protein
MNPRSQYPLEHVHAPKGGPFGRPLGVRDRLMGLAFIAALLLGLWLFVRPEPFTITVTEEHVLDSGQWTVSSALADYTVFVRNINLPAPSTASTTLSLNADGKFVRKLNPTTTLFLSTYGNNESMRSLAEAKETELLAISDDPQEVRTVEFSNVIVVCRTESSCESIKKNIINSAQRVGIFEPLGT